MDQYGALQKYQYLIQLRFPPRSPIGSWDHLLVYLQDATQLSTWVYVSIRLPGDSENHAVAAYKYVLCVYFSCFYGFLKYFLFMCVT
jgi:hypothetical protein